MGTMAGDDGGTNQIGMAPEARWIGCRNMEEGWGTPSTYMECFEFFLAPYPLGGTPDGGVPELAPHVVSNSWGCPPEEGCDAEAIALLEESVQALYQAGIVVVASAGNSGSACDSVLSPPAIYPQSFTVGAFDHTTGLIASFSSRGPVTYGGDTYIKPDITAPGVKIRSSLPGGGYGDKQGTSMAAPHVAGAVALLLSAAPGYVGDVDGIELVLTSTAEPRTTTQGCGGDGTASVPNNVWGWGILDILAAVELATVGQLGGTVTDAISGLPIDGALVTAELDLLPTIRHEVTTDLSGTYTLTLPAGVYQVSADAGGYAAQKVAGVVVAGGEVTYQDLALQPVLSYYLPLWSNNP
jgi:subtilisin family serine protease